MQITKSNKQLTKNFKEFEFYSKSPDAPLSHYLDQRLIHIAQEIRTYYNSPVKVNSTLRTKSHNLAVGGGLKSQHLLGNAIDLGFSSEVHEKLTQDLINRTGVYNSLLKLGLGGLGLYDTFIHFDVREKTNNRLAFWDYRVKKKEGINLINLTKGENKRYIWLLFPIGYLIYKFFK